ncbi:unnamed protein product [Lepidochelys kempii]
MSHPVHWPGLAPAWECLGGGDSPGASCWGGERYRVGLRHAGKEQRMAWRGLPRSAISRVATPTLLPGRSPSEFLKRWVPGKRLTLDSLLFSYDHKLPPPVPLVPVAQRPLGQQDWYHGSLPRQEAQALLTSEGDFLVRASQGRPGAHVLSALAGGQCRHFIIQCRKVRSSVGRGRDGEPRRLCMPARRRANRLKAMATASVRSPGVLPGHRGHMDIGGRCCHMVVWWEGRSHACSCS